MHLGTRVLNLEYDRVAQLNDRLLFELAKRQVRKEAAQLFGRKRLDLLVNARVAA